MERCKTTLLTVILALSFPSCETKTNKGSETASTVVLGTIESLTPRQFSQKMSGFDEINLLDVRTADEYAASHLDHAANVDVNSPDFGMNVSTLKKETPIFVYCRSGSRSLAAAETLQKLGFAKIYNLEGGAKAWQEAGFELVTPSDPANKGMSMDDYKKLTSSSMLVLVDFSAVWCGPCRQLKPIIEKIGEKNKDILKLVEIDVDENPMLAGEMNISSIPTLKLYKNGSKVWSAIGFDENTETNIYQAILKNK